MNTAKHHSPESIAYARSLLELAEERNIMEPVGQELHDLSEAVQSDPRLRQYFTDPTIGESERDDLIQRALAPRLNKLTADFLRVVNSRNALRRLDQIAAAYDDLLEEKLGKVEVDITVAQRLDPADLESVRQKISAAIKRDAVLHQYVDEKIIGGVVLRIGDKLIDGSVRHQLDSIRRQLLSSRKR